MKYFALLLTFAVLTPFLYADSVIDSKNATGNLILASVNGEVITEADILPLTAGREKQARAVYSGERLTQMIYNCRKEVVNELIDNILVQAEFNRFNYTLPAQEIEREIDKFSDRIGRLRR